MINRAELTDSGTEMVSKTNKQALEIEIEKQLTGTCLKGQQAIAEGKDVKYSPLSRPKSHKIKIEAG